MNERSIKVLKSQGFFFIKELDNGMYRAQYDKTVYYNLYVDGNSVRQA
jgi:RimJ/RimL family protein N-acetyltransferase